jgi:YidC/Oxa1 family membrane protein insertase
MEQKRFILAMVLSAIVVILWQVFLAPPVEPPPGEEPAAVEETTDEAPGDEQIADADADPQTDTDDADQAAQADRPDEADQAAQEPAAARPDVDVRRDVLKNDRFTIEVTNDQGRITSILLTEPEQYQERGDLIGFPDDAPHYPFRTGFLDKNVDFPDDAVFEMVEEESKKRSDGTYTKIVYRYDDPQGRFAVDKTFEIDESLPYVVDMDLTLHNKLDGVSLVDTLAVDMFSWKDPDQESSFLDFRPNEIEGVCLTTADLERENFGSVADSPFSFDEGDVLWGAVDTRYFMTAAIPEEAAERCEMDIVDDNYIRTRLVHDDFSIEAGNAKTFSHQLFLGPKNVDVLNEVGHRLEESVDYGMFAFIARPLRWALANIFNLVGNWGLAIILLTFLIRGALWPVNMKAYSSMERMKKVQPKLKELKEKYEDDRQRMTEETMKVFREENVSPAGGCLPMLMQMPILYGLYIMIYYSVDLYHADFALWYTNLAEPDPYYVLPAMMGVVMFAQQRMSTMDTTNKQAAMMMKIMPVMFTAFMIFLPSGLVLYYALSLLIGVLQQFYVRKKFRGDDDEEDTKKAKA